MITLKFILLHETLLNMSEASAFAHIKKSAMQNYPLKTLIYIMQVAVKENPN